MRFCTALLFILLTALQSPVLGQMLPETRPVTRPADEWQISVITFGCGSVIYERYGHVAIRLKNDARDIDICYDWGNFDFNAPGFLFRFAKGDLQYWMEGKYTSDMFIEAIRIKDRTVTEQVLNLTATQSAKMRLLIVDQDDEAHRFYPYDYFKDNCSTRIRDLIDQATDGALQPLKKTRSPHTYRWHDRRLLSVGLDNMAINSGMEIVGGTPLDLPLTEWEACYLPTLLDDALDHARIADPDGTLQPLVRERRVLNVTSNPANFEPADALNPAWWMLPIGVVCGGALLGLSRVWPLGFKLGASLWQLVSLLGALMIPAMVLFTRHWPAAWNENLLQFTPLSLVVLVAIWFRRWRGSLAWGPALTLGLSLLGLAITISHLTPQRNAAVLCLTVPLHVAVFVGHRQLRKGIRNASVEPPIEKSITAPIAST